MKSVFYFFGAQKSCNVSFFNRFLLFLNQKGRRSSIQPTLIVLYLFTSFPTVLFKIIRYPAVFYYCIYYSVLLLCFLLLYLLQCPDWVADGLRGSICSGILCLLIGVLLVITEVRGIGQLSNCQCNFYCFCYCLGIALLFFFTIRYLCLETWQSNCSIGRGVTS